MTLRQNPSTTPEAANRESNLTVFVTTGEQTMPIKGARVTITRQTQHGEILYDTLETDGSGKTIRLILPAPLASLSEAPQTQTPAFGLYFAQVSHPDYYTEENLLIQVFGGAASYLNVNLIPLPGNHEQGVR